MQKAIYIVDDNPDFRESTAWWLEGAGYHVESFASPKRALAELSSLKQSKDACILMDVRMPEMSGLDLHDQLNDGGVNIPIIYMTGHANVPIAVTAMQKGAVTYLEKPLDSEALQKALDSAFLSQQNPVNNTADNDTQQDPACVAFHERYATLTPREIEVLRGIVDGKMNKVIAYELGISIKTIEIHRSQVKKKMQAKSATDLVKMVLTKRILNNA